jgi:hypothetical protein
MAEELITNEPELFYLPEGNNIMTLKEYQDALCIKTKDKTKI